jgi:glycosyltransferase involved in cell wall biosynthesis
MRIPVYIFSFNRGRFLEIAVQSVKENFPSTSICIVDDNSDDPETIAVLENLRNSVEVFAHGDSRSADTTGSLHSNMNYALSLAEAAGAKLALFMQDDQQIVRRVTEVELDLMQTFFDLENCSFVLHTCFMKKGSDRGHQDKLKPYGDFFHRDPAVKTLLPWKGFGYSDVGIFSIPRCRETLGVLFEGEPRNMERAEQLGLQLGFLHVPFMHHLPFPISFRRKGRSFFARLADGLSGAAVHKFSTMSDESVQLMAARDRTSLAYAEDWLVAPTAPVAETWSIEGGMKNLVHRGGWRRKIAGLYFRLHFRLR